ncbi:MAG: hypothetical protein LUG98_02645 [Tannerellaceae bacterium]|nr:hypothetical protein [Tannerellaceae bacterium]
MKRLREGILFLFLVAGSMAGNLAWGQQTLIDVMIDPPAILIGEQTIVTVNVTTDRGKPVRLLIPRDTLARGIEILAVSEADTTLIDNNRVVFQHNLLVTSFDSALYLVPPIRVIDGTDTIQSNQIPLKVSTVPVNADEPDEFYDIKEVWKPPFVLADYYPLIFGIILGLLLIVLLYFLIQKIRGKEPANPFKKPEPVLPPHVIAVKELDDIKTQKLWQQGRNKEYYTQITDTLRKYIVGRFGINAMEMTSGEILEIIRKNTEADSVYVNLKQILEVSDFVKFAKMNPLPDENELSLMNAYLFVNQTKPTEIPAPGEKEAGDENGEAEKKQI